MPSKFRAKMTRRFFGIVALVAALYAIDFFLSGRSSTRVPASAKPETHPGYGHVVSRPMVEPWLEEAEYLRLPEKWTGAWKSCHERIAGENIDETEKLRQRTNLIGFYYGLSPSPENFGQKRPGRVGATVPMPLPWGLTKYPAGKLGPNCMLCHGGIDANAAPNPSIANNHLRLHLLLEDVLKVRRGEGALDKQIEEYLTLFGERGFGTAPGLTTGSTLIHLSMLKRDPETLELRGKAGKFGKVLYEWALGRVHPVSLSTPPLGHVHMKDRLYGAGFIANDGNAGVFAFSQFLYSSERPIEDIENEIEKYFTQVYQWIAALPPLPPPRRLPAEDPEVALGRGVYQKLRCAQCHVSSTEQPMRKYTMGTDAALSKQNEIYVNYLKGSRRLGKYVSETGDTAPGYGARPLNGIAHKTGWLHNGAIPGCEAFVGLKNKPKFWRVKPIDPADEKTCRELRAGDYRFPVSPSIEALKDWKDVERLYPKATAPRDFYDWYDTTRYGQTNPNPYHERDFETLPPEQKLALCRYLETL